MADEWMMALWNSLVSPLDAKYQAMTTELLAVVARYPDVFPEGAAEMAMDDCIIICPERKAIGKTSLFPRLHDAAEAARLLEVVASNSERRIMEAADERPWDDDERK